MSKPFLGHCMMCHNSPVEVRYLDLYVVESEGLYVCHSCEMQIVKFVRDSLHKNGLAKRQKMLEERNAKTSY